MMINFKFTLSRDVEIEYVKSQAKTILPFLVWLSHKILREAFLRIIRKI